MYCGYGKSRELQNIEEEWEYIEPITNPPRDLYPVPASLMAEKASEEN
jgi:hypothetical protein